MTRKLARTVTVACLVAAAALAMPASSGAKVLVGIGDQNAQDLFPNPLFKKLGMKRARIVAPWNVALKRRDAKYLDHWLQLASDAGVEPLLHFASASGSHCPASPCRLPTVSQYRNAFEKFRDRWPDIRVIGAWNEANHRTQPTFKNPKRAAQFFNIVRGDCDGCKIIAADVIDERRGAGSMVKWLKVFKRYAKGPRIWGLHNYEDTNYASGKKTGGTRRLLRTVRGEVWLTETGGLVKFLLSPRGPLPPSERRADAATQRMFRLAKRYRSRIKRLYIYNWRAPFRGRFDSGLLRYDFKPRPAYFTVKRNLATPFFGP